MARRDVLGRSWYALGMPDDYINSFANGKIYPMEVFDAIAGAPEEWPLVDDELAELSDSVGLEPVFEAELAPFQGLEPTYVGLEPVFEAELAPFQPIDPVYVGLDPVFEAELAPFQPIDPPFVGMEPVFNAELAPFQADESIYVGAERRLGSGARFRRLKRRLEQQGAHDAEALAAWIGRRKYGAAKMVALARAGRRRQLRALGY